MIISTPWWFQSIGPYPLQVCRQASRPGTADKKITAKLIVELYQVGIDIPVLQSSYPGIGGEEIPVA